MTAPWSFDSLAEPGRVDVAALRAAAEAAGAKWGRSTRADLHVGELLALLDRLEAAEAKVARVEALASRKRVMWNGQPYHHISSADLRAALDDTS
mgnify:CR=1 FL=1